MNFVISIPPIPKTSLTPQLRSTGWDLPMVATAKLDTPVALICMSVALSTLFYTFCTPASGTRSCLTLDMCQVPSPSIACSIRAMYRPLHSATREVSRCLQAMLKSVTAHIGTRVKRFHASTARWAKASRTSSPLTRCTTSMAPTLSVSTR